MSERKGEEMPILFANPRKDKSALSRNSRIRWPKEIFDHMLANKAYLQYRLNPCHLARIKREYFGLI